MPLRPPIPRPYFSSSSSLHIHSLLRQTRQSSTLPSTPTCPSPKHPSAPTPCIPPNLRLEINHSLPLNGTLAPFSKQILICTGKDDWTSRIEVDGEENLAWRLKRLMGRGGEFVPEKLGRLSILNISLQSEILPSSGTADKDGNGNENTRTVSAYILPAFKYVPFISLSSHPPGSLETEDEAGRNGTITPQKFLKDHVAAPFYPSETSDSAPTTSAHVFHQTQAQDLLILICGHGGRDARCGIYGPVLRDEFTKVLERLGIEVLHGAGQEGDGNVEGKLRARVALTSHVGGHQFAGNVGVWLPPQWGMGSEENQGEEEGNRLEGKGIWYGRVEPRHVEGILEETVVKGRVVRELFRGGVGEGGEVLRL